MKEETDNAPSVPEGNDEFPSKEAVPGAALDLMGEESDDAPSAPEGGDEPPSKKAVPGACSVARSIVEQEERLQDARVQSAGARGQPPGAEDCGGGEPESPAKSEGSDRSGKRGRGGEEGPGVPAQR